MSYGARDLNYTLPLFFLGATSTDSDSLSDCSRFRIFGALAAFFAFTSALRAASPSPSSSSSSDAKSSAAAFFFGAGFFPLDVGFAAGLLDGVCASSSSDAKGSSAPAFFLSFGFGLALVAAPLSTFFAAASSAAALFAALSSEKYSSLSACAGDTSL